MIGKCEWQLNWMTTNKVIMASNQNEWLIKRDAKCFSDNKTMLLRLESFIVLVIGVLLFLKVVNIVIF